MLTFMTANLSHMRFVEKENNGAGASVGKWERSVYLFQFS